MDDRTSMPAFAADGRRSSAVGRPLDADLLMHRDFEGLDSGGLPRRNSRCPVSLLDSTFEYPPSTIGSDNSRQRNGQFRRRTAGGAFAAQSFATGNTPTEMVNSSPPLAAAVCAELTALAVARMSTSAESSGGSASRHDPPPGAAPQTQRTPAPSTTPPPSSPGRLKDAG